MKHLLWLLKWMLKAAIFFILFAFALNNQEDVTVRFFFGTHWHTPLVLVVLSTFTLGVAVGVLGMVPRWWMHRKAARRTVTPPPVVPPPAASSAAAAPSPSSLPPHGI